MKKLDKEVEKKAGKHEPKYPQTRKEYRRWIKELSKKYGVPAWQIENTIRELGVEETLKRLEAMPKAEKRSIWRALAENLKRFKRP